MLSTQKIFYVYLILCTRCAPLYVGKGTGGRAYNHFEGSGSHNKQVRGMWKKARAAGLELPVVVLHEGLTEAAAFELEVFWIRTLGRLDKGEGPLVNHTDGGEGVSGYKRTPAQCEAMSKARTGKSLPPHVGRAVSKALKGRPKTPEHAAAVSKAKKGVPLGPMSDHQRQAIGNSLRGRTRSEKELEACAIGRAAMTEEAKQQKSERITLALTGKPLSVAHRINIGLAQKNAPEEKKAQKAEKLRKAHKGKKKSADEIAARRKKVDAVAICRRYAEGESMAKLAKAFGVSEQVIDTRLIEGGIKKRTKGDAVRLHHARQAREKIRNAA